MAAFMLEDGEQIVREVRLDTIHEGVIVEVKVFMTDRRIALVPHKRVSRLWAAMPFYMWFVAKSVASTGKVSHQIRRDNIASIEPSGPRSITVKSRGEGYGMVWFDLVVNDLDGWLADLKAWAAGART